MTIPEQREEMLSHILKLQNGATTFGQKGSKHVLLSRDAFDAICALLETLTFDFLVDVEKKA